MRVLVCEFVTGGGFAGAALPAGLCREGDMMLQALVKDLAEISDLAITYARDRRLSAPGLPGAALWIGESADPWLLWRDALADADALWPIAPETNGILERLSRLAAASGRTLLGCRPDAVQLTASKRRTAEHLARHGVAVPPTLPLLEAVTHGLPPAGPGWVVKPDDGAGAEETLLFHDPAMLRRWTEGAAEADKLVVQPYLPGPATSLSLLCRDGAARVLSCNLQDVRLDGGRFRYRGGTVGGAEGRRASYGPIADAVAAAIPGLWGHVGVDLVDTPDGPVVLEINPRLTTSYAGLGAALGSNPAALVLQLLTRDIAEIAIPQSPRGCHVAVDDDAA